MALFSSASPSFVILQLCLLIQSCIKAEITEPTLPICPGTCISRDSSCNTTVDKTNCGNDAICCLDNFETATEPGFDFSTLPSRTADQWMSTVDDSEVFDPETESSSAVTKLFETEDHTYFASTSEAAEDFFTTESISEAESFEQCPGACIPKKHAALCHYAIQSDTFCPQDKICCATREAAEKLFSQADAEISQDSSQDECPGRCVHPSLTAFCDRVLLGYNCPLDSKCCDSQIVSTETTVAECTGICLPPQNTYLCLSPYELVPGTSNCKKSTVCCMKASEENAYEPPEQESRSAFSDVHFQELTNTFETVDRTSGGGLASDENGQIYSVHQNGQFRPLQTLTPKESLNPNFQHFADVEVEKGKASLYRDNTGTLYQLSVIESPQSDFQNFHGSPQSDFQNFHGSPQSDFQNFRSSPQSNFQNFHGSLQPGSQDFRTMGFINNRETFSPSGKENIRVRSQQESLKPMMSAPDDSDDMEENLQDIIVPDEGEDLLGSDSAIPPGERTLIKPECPGSCVSTLLRFTCTRKSTIYDGFSCPKGSICCASLTDIEEHEKYLGTLSPYFKATPIENEENRMSCFAGTLKEVTPKSSVIADYCWQVALINSRNQYICGGVIIADSWVLTAAHCVTGALRQEEALYVRSGVTDLTHTGDSAVGQTRRALSVFVHHKHNSMSLDNDIALLRLQTPLELSVNACIACLPTKESMPPSNSKCVVTGYGFVSKAGTMSLRIHDSSVYLVDDMDCIANVTDALATVFILPGSSFCAGGEGSNNACQGDAGGPLICYNEGRYELTGLVSWGLGCGRDDIPSIYVKIPSFMSWINQIISASAFLKALS